MSGVFISYRRSDSAPWAGRLRDRLVAELPDHRICFDIDNIGLGVDFRQVIADTIASCEDVLVLIGPDWLKPDADGARRLDDTGDFHRVEVESALASGARVIPILVGGAAMPSAGQLPSSIRELAYRNALPIAHGSFGRDADVLIRALRRSEEPPVARAAPAAEQLGIVTASPAPSRPAGRNRFVVIGAVAAVAAAIAIGVVATSGGGGDDQASAATTTVAVADTKAAALVAQTAAATTATSAAVAATVVLPDRATVYDRPVDESMAVLEAAGLTPQLDELGCSNTVQPGRVRLITVGDDPDVGILYGKAGEEIDLVAAAALSNGDVVTVWTPTSNPC